jgi:hypothetical protein
MRRRRFLDKMNGMKKDEQRQEMNFQNLSHVETGGTGTIETESIREAHS